MVIDLVNYLWVWTLNNPYWAPFFWTSVLFYGFLFYASAIQAWVRWHIGIKILVAPGLLVFGLIDVAFNIMVGTILFLELPFLHGLTFSQRCSYHLNDNNFRGRIAGAVSVPLNAVVPNHIYNSSV